MNRHPSKFQFLMLMACLSLAGCATSPQQIQAEAQVHRAAKLNAQLGIDYMRTGNLKMASRKLEAARKQDPNSSMVRNAYALLMQRLGRYQAADANFSRAIELKPQYASAHNDYGVFLCEQGHYQRAYTQFREAWKNPLYDTPEFAYANAGSCALKQDNKILAEKYFNQALNNNPGFVPALYQLAKLLADQGHIHRADAYLGRITGRARYTPEILALCLKVKRALGDMNGATVCARDLYRIFPNSPQARALLHNQ